MKHPINNYTRDIRSMSLLMGLSQVCKTGPPQSQGYLAIFPMKGVEFVRKNPPPGDSSRDLFIPDRWVGHQQPLRGSRELTMSQEIMDSHPLPPIFSQINPIRSYSNSSTSIEFGRSLQLFDKQKNTSCSCSYPFLRPFKGGYNPI